MEKASEVERLLKTEDGIKVHWCINPIPTNKPHTEQAKFYKLYLSVMDKGSSDWGEPHEFYPLIDEVSTRNANDEFRIDVDKVESYLFQSTLNQDYAENWRMLLFGPSAKN